MSNSKTVRRRYLLQTLLVLQLIPAPSGYALADTRYSIHGTVFDEATFDPIIAANIQVLDRSFGAAARPDGGFVIEGLASGSYTLLVSAIGFESKLVEVVLPHESQVEIGLKETFFQMESVVITGTRTEKIHLNTPVATEVITTQDIQDSGARDLGELLEQRSGVSVSSSVEGGSIVNVLGMDSKYVMLLVDGQPVTGKFNNRIMLDQIPISSIENVEIVKGPGSSLYGSEAMGGVINVITSKDSDLSAFTINLRHSDRAQEYNPANLESGQHNLILSYHHPGEVWSYGADADVLFAHVDKSIQHIDVDRYQTTSLRGRIRYAKGSAHSLEANGSQYVNTESGSADLLESETLISRSGGILKYQWTPNKRYDLQLVSRGERYQRDYFQARPWGQVLRDELTQENQLEVELTGNLNLGHHTITAGSEIGTHRYSSQRVAGGKRDVREQAIFLQAESTPISEWTFVVGTRWDQSTDFSAVWSPRLAILYQPDTRWRYRLSAGTGYRKPSFMDRYIDWNHQQFGYRIQGNPDLDPERSVGVSLGIDYYHPAQYQASLFLYQNRFTNMIVDALLQPGLFTYVNVDQVNYSGLELQVRRKVNSSWLSSWGYTYSLNRNAETGEIVPNLPVHSGTIRLTYKQSASRWSTSVKLKVVDGYTVDEFIVLTQQLERGRRSGYLMLDVDAHYNLRPWLRLTSGMKNSLDMTDDRYGPFFGRTLYLEIQSKLKGI